MKQKMTRLLTLVLSLLFVVTPLSACANSGPLKIVKKGESKYRIVYENTSREAGNAAERLAENLEELTGVLLEVTDDRTEVDKKIPEILVGRTNRGIDYQPQRTLRYGGYVIAREGKNLFILGAGEGVLKVACDDFITDVLDADYKVSGKGVLLASEAKHSAQAVTLNGRPVTDYTVYLPEESKLDWKACLACVEEQLTALSGFMMTTVEYVGAASASGPAIVLQEDSALGKAEYSINVSGDKITLSASSDEAVRAMAVALYGRLTNKKAKEMSLSLETLGGNAGEAPMVPLADADLRVMSFNVFGNDVHKSMMPYVSASALAYGADFICMQEFYGVAYDTVAKDLEAAGYAVVGTTFTEVSPTATEKNDAKYTKLGKMCNTPIFYRADLWEPVESGAYLFYWRSRYHGSNTKSLAYGVFRNKSTGELISVISTHFPLMASTYATKDGIPYSDYTDGKEGAQWRYEAALEVMKQVDALRAKYPGILTVVGGDMNAKSTEKGMKAFEEHAVLSNAILMAPSDKKSLGGSFHEYGKAPGANGQPIDHWFVSEDVASVLRHCIVSDALTVKGTDHCPVVVDIVRK